jgi:hypothetical protein
MKYIFDNNTLTAIFRHYYFGRFPSFWAKFNYLVNAKEITSVREVKKELQGKNIDIWAVIKKWSNDHPDFFSNPTNEELEFITKIYSVRHFQQNIGKKMLYKGTPVADPFLVAKAKINNSNIVTQEKYKANSSSIPNICKHFEVDYLDLEGFLIAENWEF